MAKRLEMLGFTFTGADSETLALSQDKYRVKVLLEQAGIPTPAWRIFHDGEPCAWDRFPAIVKPMNEHCSAGITRESVVLNQTELENRILFILDTYQQPAMVEDFIDGREFHVSVWGNEKLTVLPVAACAAEVAGISYGQMGSMFVRLAARRHPVFGKMSEPQNAAKKQSAIKRSRAKRASSFKEPQAS
ncbi:MAG: hypothetical protein CVU51_08030 [Deltaproteobacteria bacterium HGW-Deltaproteobacteria-1]|nr:MAG: hypothetical protein CVU51_08030 [Deltaproteobacteria bacterium HGW-Deltaproteobacteria-1]